MYLIEVKHGIRITCKESLQLISIYMWGLKYFNNIFMIYHFTYFKFAVKLEKVEKH